MGRRKFEGSPFDTITEDGILRLILSNLTLKEAVRTSVLSRRWRYVWTYLNKLEFDAHNIFHADNFDMKIQKSNNLSHKFITSVDSFLKQHQGTGIEKFSVEYILHKIHSQYLDAWVDFAVASKSKSISLFLWSNEWMLESKMPESYVFPCHLLGSSHIEHLCLCVCSLKPPNDFSGLRYLKVLNLFFVDVTDDDIRHVLSNCSTLVRLVLEKCQKLATLSISHPLNRLQDLYVLFCKKLTKIEIEARDLTNLYYRGHVVEFILRESSQLTRATVSFTRATNSALAMLVSKLPCLKNLHFLVDKFFQGTPDFGSNSNRFIHLKCLTWEFYSALHNKKGLLCLASLLSLAPFLETLSLDDSHIARLRELKQTKMEKPCLHNHLKTVKYIGFTSDKWQIRFAVHILKCAIKLESMTIQKFREVQTFRGYDEYFETNLEHLVREVPANVKLVIF